MTELGPNDGHPMPTSVAGYQLLLPVGAGGMGVVYLAQREVVEGVSRWFALKLLHGDLSCQPKVAEELLHEARVAAHIHHPNVVAAREAGRDAGTVFLAMDFVEGTTLASLIVEARKRDLRLPVSVVGRIAVDALRGLHAAHEAVDADGKPLAIIHRDFSPQNIMVGLDGVSRLTDFGIAKALNQSTTTATGVVKGKISYMAPEQALGHKLDRRVDVWAAGVVIHEALTGKRLFAGSSDAERLLAIVSGPPPRRLSEVREDLPAEIDEVVHRALTRQPDERTPDADTLRRNIEAAWDGNLATAEEVGEWVERLAGEGISERRRQAEEVARLRQQVAEVAGRAFAEAEQPHLTPGKSDRSEESTVTARALTTSTRRSVPSPKRSRAYVPGIVAAVAVALGGFYFSRPPSTKRVNPLASVPLPEAPVTPTSPAEREETRGPVTVEANAPIAQWRVGAEGAWRTLPVAANKLALDGPAEATTFEAVAKDGRRATVELRPGQTELKVVFSAVANRPTPRPHQRKAPVSTPSPKPTPKGPRRAPGAYGIK